MTKNEKIKQSLIETRQKRLTQKCFTIELKIKKNRLSKQDKNQLDFYFIQCKWLYNYLLSLKDIKSFKTTERKIYSFDKDGNKLERILNLPAKFIQSVYQEVFQNIRALSGQKKNKLKVGKLRFKSNYTSIDLNQYGITHFIENNRFKIVGIKNKLKVFGLDQLKCYDNLEFANAKLIKKASGYYIRLTCYKNLTYKNIKNNKPKKPIGLDFGIKTTLTTSENEKFNIIIEESERLKNLQRKLSRQKKNSNNYYKTRLKLEREYEKLINKKKDKVNKLVSYLCSNYSTVYLQDEMISKWHQEKFLSKTVQHSCLGLLKQKLKNQNNVFLISKNYPTTKLCYNCGTLHNDITLKNRTFICPSCGFSEDRDVKAAKTIMFIGQCLNSYSTTEHSTATVEKMQDFLYFSKKQFSKKQEVYTPLGYK